MSVRIGCGLSTDSDARDGALEAAQQARAALNGEPVSLAIVFAAGAHLSEPESTLAAAHEQLSPGVLIGCGAGGVLGQGREVEQGTAVAVWAASLPDAMVTPFHAEVEPLDEQRGAVVGMPDLAGASAVLMLPDPYTFPSEQLLAQLAEHAPGVPVIGGLSSGRLLDGSAALFVGEQVHESGIVGVRLDGVEVLPCVSQGATPVGPELTVTAVDGNVILELAGQPALAKLREVLGELPCEERDLVAAGPLIGLVLGPVRPEYHAGDFLVRGVLGADPDTGALALGAPVEEGQVVRLHVRDAKSADRDLRDALALRRLALGGTGAAGALMFTCNGRGQAMFGERDHDALTLTRELPGMPAAGFFAAGEIGPVGGENFLHGFTATVAVFAS
jgi:small ligand-binding sensory domain FIST